MKRSNKTEQPTDDQEQHENQTPQLRAIFAMDPKIVRNVLRDADNARAVVTLVEISDAQARLGRGIPGAYVTGPVHDVMTLIGYVAAEGHATLVQAQPL